MKRVGGNVSIEKVTQPKSSAVTITPNSSSSHDDNDEEDDYYDEAEEEEEFEPSPPVVRKPNLTQVQITPRNVSRPALNITPVAQPGGNRSIPQVCSFGIDTKLYQLHWLITAKSWELDLHAFYEMGFNVSRLHKVPFMV